MDINLDLIKQIISSDELCIKVNSTTYRDSYKNQIRRFVLYLCDDSKTNIKYINRYLKYFVINGNNKEEMFFDPVVLKSYSKNITDSEYLNIIKSFGFFDIKELLMKKYDQIIKSNSDYDLTRMFNFYMYICGNTILPNNYIDYFVKKSTINDFTFNQETIIYFYKQFALSYSNSRGLNVNFNVMDNYVKSDPYYDNKKNSIFIYKHDLSSKINYSVLASIFSQIKYLYVLRSINDTNNNTYSFEQLRLVKELCLISILGEEAFNNSYSHISFSNTLHHESYDTVLNYLKKLGISKNFDNIEFDLDTSVGSIDVLFDSVIKREGVNLLKSLIKNYPVLACEYKIDKKKSLLSLLLDIYSNRKLLVNLNKDLEWYKNKNDNEFAIAKITRLENKISICESCINVMNLIVNNGDMLLEDLLRSISDLILYDTNREYIKNDIYSVLKIVVPRKLSKMCSGKDSKYVEDVRKKVVECYLQSLNTVRSNMDMDYFMKLYSTLDNINKVFENNKNN